jgi:hypothetical protein
MVLIGFNFNRGARRPYIYPIHGFLEFCHYFFYFLELAPEYSMSESLPIQSIVLRSAVCPYPKNVPF